MRNKTVTIASLEEIDPVEGDSVVNNYGQVIEHINLTFLHSPVVGHIKVNLLYGNGSDCKVLSRRDEIDFYSQNGDAHINGLYENLKMGNSVTLEYSDEDPRIYRIIDTTPPVPVKSNDDIQSNEIFAADRVFDERQPVEMFEIRMIKGVGEDKDSGCILLRSDGSLCMNLDCVESNSKSCIQIWMGDISKGGDHPTYEKLATLFKEYNTSPLSQLTLYLMDQTDIAEKTLIAQFDDGSFDFHEPDTDESMGGCAWIPQKKFGGIAMADHFVSGITAPKYFERFMDMMNKQSDALRYPNASIFLHISLRMADDDDKWFWLSVIELLDKKYKSQL